MLKDSYVIVLSFVSFWAQDHFPRVKTGQLIQIPIFQLHKPNTLQKLLVSSLRKQMAFPTPPMVSPRIVNSRVNCW